MWISALWLLAGCVAVIAAVVIVLALGAMCGLAAVYLALED